MTGKSMVQEVEKLRAQGWCKIVFPGGHFLFTCSDIFAVWWIILPQCTVSQTDRQTDRHYHAN